MKSAALVSTILVAIHAVSAGPLFAARQESSLTTTTTTASSTVESTTTVTSSEMSSMMSSMESSSEETESMSETATETESETSSETATETETSSETATETESSSETETVTESETASETETETETATETESSETETATETDSESSATTTATGTITTGAASTSSAKTATATAVPSPSPNVTQILQLALNLEHLEMTFYNEGLRNFTIEDFGNAGLPPWAYGRFEQIRDHESEHVAFLTRALGDNAPAACNYTFPTSVDPWSFIALAETLESVGNAAYIGGAKFLANDTDALTAAASILSVEARHASWIKSTLYQSDPWSTSFDTPIDGNFAYSLASQFIVNCPASNPKLPFKQLPGLNVTNYTPSSEMLKDGSTYMPTLGGNITLQYNSSAAANKTQYLAFLSGFNTTFAPISQSKTVTIPVNLQGLVFAAVTTNNTILSDDYIVAGPAILDFTVGANATSF